MNFTETTALCAWLSRVKPAQEFDDMTPQLWQPLLRDVAVEDARQVCVDIIRAQQWIDPNDIVQAVKRLRRDRLTRAGYDDLDANVDPADTGRWLEERRALRDAIASGRMSLEEVEAYKRDEVPPLTGGDPFRRPGELVARKMPAIDRVTRKAS